MPLVAPAADRARPYTLVDDRLWFVDTGASRTTCDDDFVAALGLVAKPTALRTHGEVGSVPIRRVVLRDVEIGGWTFRRLPCAVRDLATTSSIPFDPSDPVAGILGANVLRSFVADFDFSERRLRLREEAPEGFEGGVRLRRERGVGPRLLAPLHVDGARVDVVVDTGADRTYLPVTSGEEVARYTAERQGTGPGGATAVEVVIRTVDEAAIRGRPVPIEQYVYRRGRPGLLGMDALGVARVVVDPRRLRMDWSDAPAPPLLRPDEGRRGALEADGSAAGLRRLAGWELWRGDAARAADLYARLGDGEAHAFALLVAGRWEEGRAAVAGLEGEHPLAALVAAVEGGPVDAGGPVEAGGEVVTAGGVVSAGGVMSVGGVAAGAEDVAERGFAAGAEGAEEVAEIGFAAGAAVAGEGGAAGVHAAGAVEAWAGRAGHARRASGAPGTLSGGTLAVGLWRLRRGEPLPASWDAGPGPYAEAMAALARDATEPGAAIGACARLPAPRDADEVAVLVACGQHARAAEALAGMVPGAVAPPGMPEARARAAWLDARALLATAAGDHAVAREALELAVRLAPWDPYLHLRRAEVRGADTPPRDGAAGGR